MPAEARSPAVRVTGLGKRFDLGETVDLSRTFREAIMDRARRLGRSKAAPPERETLWALRDVSFEVGQGETIGIIGRNGAGKSTLLKILSRITSPTTGRAEIRGRVGSLLEVGTGFHSELTGRENIYLNGAILGMRRSEIHRRFDEIVAFAETERFLDTPVKRYSSGMRVRLGFAVAAHLDLEVLIVDEVLSVGDAEFRRKSMARMHDVASSGRTVLFVSHNMQAIQNLCDRGILLDHGQIVRTGAVQEVVDAYLNSGRRQEPGVEIPKHLRYDPDAPLEIFRIQILDRSGRPTDSVALDEEFRVEIHYRIHDPIPSFRISVGFFAPDETRVCSTISTSGGLPPVRGDVGTTYSISVRIRNVLTPGSYHLDVYVKNSANEWVDAIRGIAFTVLPVATAQGDIGGPGLVQLDAEWGPPLATEADTRPPSRISSDRS